MLNSVNLQGRICRDLELKSYDFKGQKIPKLTFGLAVQTGKKDKDGKNECNFILCEATGAKAENLCKYQKKGSQIIVSGSLVRQAWKKDDKHYEKYFVKVNEIYFCDAKKKDDSNLTTNTTTTDSLPF